MKTNNLNVSSLYKQFNDKEIFSDINFNLNSGELLLIGGINGIGKSTLLKTIIGIISPNSGVVQINGNRKIKEYIGYSSSNERSFFLRLNAFKNLEFFLGMRGFSSEDIKNRINFFSDFFGIKDSVMKKKYQYLSSGEKKKISLIRAFIHDPELIILDEPSESLDFNSKSALLELLQSKVFLSKHSMCILASHSLKDFFDTSTQFLILKDNKHTLIKKSEVSDYKSLEPHLR